MTCKDLPISQRRANIWADDDSHICVIRTPSIERLEAVWVDTVAAHTCVAEFNMSWCFATISRNPYFKVYVLLIGANHNIANWKILELLLVLKIAWMHCFETADFVVSRLNIYRIHHQIKWVQSLYFKSNGLLWQAYTTKIYDAITEYILNPT